MQRHRPAVLARVSSAHPAVAPCPMLTQPQHYPHPMASSANATTPDAMAAAQCICSLIVLLAASQQLLPSSGNVVAAANLLNPTDPAARGWRTAGTDTEPAAPPKFPWWDPSLPFDHRIDLLVAAMNITEKISQLVKCVLGCTGSCWEYCAGGRGLLPVVYSACHLLMTSGCFPGLQPEFRALVVFLRQIMVAHICIICDQV